MSQRNKPPANLSQIDKAVLRLLSKILIENVDGCGGNHEPGKVSLSDHQASELLELLEILIQDERFFRRLAFVNQIVDASPLDEKLDLKLARLTGKRPIGAGIGMTSENMRKWRVRLGASFPQQANDPLPMTFTHFLKLEQKLLNELGVDPRVAGLVMNAAARNEQVFLSLLRSINGQNGPAAEAPKVFRLQDLTRKFLKPLSDAHVREFPKDRVVGLFTMVSNTSILFTTRDWGVAGTISTLCGGFSMIL
ncbi:MAG: hypothetical protein JSS54_09245 [Proteobacteria bacterium]|nr:hypothetical protein [Pseudomonadota bacterium]